MAKDYVLPQCNCFCAYVKTDITKLDDCFFSLVHNKNCTKELYTTNYDKPIDDSLKNVAFKYAQDRDTLRMSPLEVDTESKIPLKYCRLCIIYKTFIAFKYLVEIFGRNIRLKNSVLIFATHKH